MSDLKKRDEGGGDSSAESLDPLAGLLTLVGDSATSIREYALLLHPDSSATREERQIAFASLQSEWTKLHALKDGLRSDSGQSLKTQMGSDDGVISEIERIRKGLGL